MSDLWESVNHRKCDHCGKRLIPRHRPWGRFIWVHRDTRLSACTPYHDNTKRK